MQKERALLAEEARQSGKPEDIVDKMVEGRLGKFYADVALLEQIFVIDNETKVAPSQWPYRIRKIIYYRINNR